MTAAREIVLSDFEDCLCCNLRRATRSVTQFFDAALAPAGLRVTQFALIVVVTASKEATINQLSEILALDRTTLTRNIKLLVKMKLIRSTRGKDRRKKVISLTADGRLKFEKAVPLWKKAQLHYKRSIGKNKFVRLSSAILKISSISGGATDPPLSDFHVI